jgi:N-acetylglucosamine-6-phosphate deacetylase
MPTHILQGTVILPDRLLVRGQVVVEDGVIQEVLEENSRHRPTIDFGDGCIAPGFIDIHTHGIAGADTMDGREESIGLMARRFAAHGVTGFLPTTVTQSIAVTAQAVRCVSSFMAAQDRQPPTGARVLGIHLEGPWISPDYKGAQNERYILPPTEEAVRTILDAAGGAVKIVSLAPELPGADAVIRLLLAAGVIVSIGHSGATYEEALHGVELGATHVTHCFNAMTPLHHRQPGIVGAALLQDKLFAELIADGVHVHPAVMRLLVRQKTRHRVMLITDSMSAAELPDGQYELGGQDVFVHGAEARLQSGALAGSTLVLDAAVRTVVQFCGVSLLDAVFMAATTPALALGLADSKGTIAQGRDADFTFLDSSLHPQGVMIGGVSLDVGATK